MTEYESRAFALQVVSEAKRRRREEYVDARAEHNGAAVASWRTHIATILQEVEEARKLIGLEQNE
jgi:hypothetical protein